VTTTEYEKNVKQPMDLGTIRKKLDLEPGKSAAYTNVSGFSKDVNRIFSNVMKVWSPGDEIADAARRLQAWWVDEWTALVPVLMNMKLEDEPKSQEEAPAECEDAVAAAAMALNERSEDFQEQIGMPDEENMRSWSHHYDVSSCDDPIFRAAMRGTDAVSFVFGLEVTWDLIQQRQQQEEDEIAMKMMEEANEEGFVQEQNDEAEDDGSNDGNEDGDANSGAPPKKGKSKIPTKSDAKVAKKTKTHSTVDSEDESEDDGSDTEMNDFIVKDEGDNDGNESASCADDSEPEGDDDGSSSSDEESVTEKHDADEEESSQFDEPTEDKQDEEAAVKPNEAGSPSSESSSNSDSLGESQSQTETQSSQEAATPPKKKHKSDNPTPPTTTSEISSGSSGSSSPEESQQSQPPEQVDEPVDEEMKEDEDHDSPAAPDEPVDSGPVYDQELANGRWICSVCTCENPRRARKCEACDKVRVRNDEEHYQRTSV
jgi:hypothetical protein